MPKITRKMMNRIHNEMRERFTPSWERQNRRIKGLEDRIAALEPQPIDPDVEKRKVELRQVMHEAMNEVTSAPPERVWELRIVSAGNTDNNRFALTRDERSVLAVNGIGTVPVTGIRQTADLDKYQICEIPPKKVLENNKAAFEQIVKAVLGYRATVIGRTL